MRKLTILTLATLVLILLITPSIRAEEIKAYLITPYTQKNVIIGKTEGILKVQWLGAGRVLLIIKMPHLHPYTVRNYTEPGQILEIRVKADDVVSIKTVNIIIEAYRGNKLIASTTLPILIIPYKTIEPLLKQYEQLKYIIKQLANRTRLQAEELQEFYRWFYQLIPLRFERVKVRVQTPAGPIEFTTLWAYQIDPLTGKKVYLKPIIDNKTGQIIGWKPLYKKPTELLTAMIEKIKMQEKEVQKAKITTTTITYTFIGVTMGIFIGTLIRETIEILQEKRRREKAEEVYGI